MLENILDFDAYLFDLDGTLINTEPLHHAAWEQTVKNHGFSLDWSFEEYLTFALKSRPHLFEAIFRRCPGLKNLFSEGEHLRQQKIAVYEKLLTTNPPDWMPGVYSFLSLLKKNQKEMVIVTNSPRKHVSSYTHLCFETFFKQIITIDDFIHPKPHPAGYLKALSNLDKKGHKCIVFEDSLKGIQSAQQAGTHALLVATDTYKKIALIDETTPCISSFNDLIAYENCRFRS